MGRKCEETGDRDIEKQRNGETELFSGFINVEGTGFVEAYSYFFEVGTIVGPYMLLIFCTALREEFFLRVKKCFNCRAAENT